MFAQAKRQGWETAARRDLGVRPDWDPLDAVPLVSAGVEARTAADRHVQLRYVRPAQGRVARFCADTLKLRPTVRVNLDERGSFFWGLIDNRTNLHEIARRLAREFGLSADQAWTATIVFTRDLMRRGLIQLELPRRAAAKG